MGGRAGQGVKYHNSLHGTETSALLSRIAGGDGIRSSVMKRRAVKSMFSCAAHQTSFSSLVSWAYIRVSSSQCASLLAVISLKVCHSVWAVYQFLCQSICPIFAR